jgi:hypothetical protein
LRSPVLARFNRLTSVTLGQRTKARRKGLLARLVAALEESRKSEANRVIRRYQFLIDKRDD